METEMRNFIMMLVIPVVIGIGMASAIPSLAGVFVGASAAMIYLMFLFVLRTSEPEHRSR